MSKMLKAEFANAKNIMSAVITKLESALANEETSAVCIERLHRNLTNALQQVQTFLPSQKNETKDPLEYIKILPLIEAAQLLLLNAKEKIPHNPSTKTEKPSEKSNHLPKLKLPVFDGNVMKYPKFISAV